MGQHMEAISGAGALQRKVKCSECRTSEEPPRDPYMCSVYVWTDVLIPCLFSQSIHNNVGLPPPTVLRNYSHGQCVKLNGPITELEGMPQRRGVQ